MIIRLEGKDIVPTLTDSIMSRSLTPNNITQIHLATHFGYT